MKKLLNLIFKHFNLYTAFSLSEVLISITVIGVIAALTIPAVMKQTQDLELKSAWKKEYSTLSQITQLIMNDNGGTMANVVADGNAPGITALYKAKLGASKSCTNSTSEGCWHKYGEWAYLNNYLWLGSYMPAPDFTWPNGGNVGLPGLVLNDGSIIFFAWYFADCKNTWRTDDPICGWITVDVNGFKHPNMVGKDIFAVWFTEKGLKPLGSVPGYYYPGGSWEMTGYNNSTIFLGQ